MKEKKILNIDSAFVFTSITAILLEKINLATTIGKKMNEWMQIAYCKAKILLNGNHILSNHFQFSHILVIEIVPLIIR